MDIDLRLVRYFLVMAEELHFTAAARRLYVSQPALSNQIRRLERQLDVELFERSARGVRLTPAGEAFLPHAREAVAAMRLGVAEASVAAGREDVLRIDLLESTLETPRAVLRQLRDRLPALRLEVTSHGSQDQHRRLLEGDLDIALGGADMHLASGIEQQVIRGEPVGVALSADHRLAGLGEVPIGELSDEVHYLPRDGFAPEWNDFVVASCRAAGFVPRRHPVSTDGTDTAMDLVRAGECVAVSLLSTAHPDGVVLRSLSPALTYSWAMRWRHAEPAPKKIRAVLATVASGHARSEAPRRRRTS